MVSALNGFGLAIGCMDILGAFFFELMVIVMLCQQRGNKAAKSAPAETDAEGNAESQQTKIFGKKVQTWMLWIYVLLLNVWIIVSALMIVGILLLKPELLLFWLGWCVAGMIFDVLFMLWWTWELLCGDAIEASTNIMISLLTMVIEFGLIYLIYAIYLNFKNSRYESNYVFHIFNLPSLLFEF